MKTLIEDILKESSFRDNKYFLSLHNGSFEKEDFVETQIQFFFAVIFFSRPLAALAAKIPSPELRMEVLRNVWEEHGEGDLTKIHGNTFIEFLSRLHGISLNEINKKALWPEIRIFNTCLIGVCVLDDYKIASAMVGMIERMFCEISSLIAGGIVRNGWIKAENMIHYDLHSALDIKHSQDFFDVISNSYTGNNKYYIEQGLKLGATLFNNLFSELYRFRNRRIYRDFDGPHSPAEGLV
ncbi:Iron-containing redox enzyme family protein [Candidatus Cyrtobacter comes]|uniref:Iron-containing redox enzyme family protein n=1 Tax=Candidatus Cyrtobacter comes TaxID=675776 RepID=A0ABU5LA41_9RICK|nr:iron-containing redox enzyme family protein [Candidatus Cyrtobacter comes]MDZ5762800.1 Iron-containing redox enzyme family protein [Candidatus Cyrtobacter comes]